MQRTKTNAPPLPFRPRKAVAERKCETCDRPSKDRECVGCRVRRSRGATIAGEQCAACGVDHPAVLRWHRFADGQQVLCANHSALAGRRRLTFEAFAAELSPRLRRALAVA